MPPRRVYVKWSGVRCTHCGALHRTTPRTCTIVGPVQCGAMQNMQFGVLRRCAVRCPTMLCPCAHHPLTPLCFASSSLPTACMCPTRGLPRVLPTACHVSCPRYVAYHAHGLPRVLSTAYHVSCPRPAREGFRRIRNYVYYSDPLKCIFWTRCIPCCCSLSWRLY